MGSTAGEGLRNATQDGTISFRDRMLASDGFRALFREGMTLVESTAAYLDGAGRTESRQLPREAALAYATESMRLTTRLMQITSWLLLQRAVNEGELTRAQAEQEHRRVRITDPASPTSPEVFVLLPPRLRDLIAEAADLKSRIERLDPDLIASEKPRAQAENAVHASQARLRALFTAA